MTSKLQEVNKELQDELTGVLTAISIVSKRLAEKISKVALTKPDTNNNKENTQ